MPEKNKRKISNRCRLYGGKAEEISQYQSKNLIIHDLMLLYMWTNPTGKY